MNKTYTVKPGDTLYGISNQFGVSVTDLAELNDIKGSNLQIGKVIIIPQESGQNPNNMFMYTVKSGDTLYKIANKYKTTVQRIIDLNYLKSTNIAPGQILRIPETYTKEEDMILPSYKNYIVKSGDTLYKIARENNVPVDTIVKDNNIINNIINVGQILKIRTSKENIITVEECYGKDYEQTNNITAPSINYIVKKGDSLYSIAKKYNTTVNAIKNKNNLTSDNLSIGQKIII